MVGQQFACKYQSLVTHRLDRKKESQKCFFLIINSTIERQIRKRERRSNCVRCQMTNLSAIAHFAVRNAELDLVAPGHTVAKHTHLELQDAALTTWPN